MGALRHYLLPYAAYVVPFAFAPLTDLPEWGYVGKNLLALGLVLAFWRHYPLRRPRPLLRTGALGVGAGLLVALLWAGLGTFPATTIESAARFYGGKALGMLLVAPLIEELFVRDFLNRVVAARDWKRAQVGIPTPLSFLATTAFFTFAHDQAVWIPAALTGALLALLLWRTKSMWTVIIAHFVANVALFLAAAILSRPELIA